MDLGNNFGIRSWGISWKETSKKVHLHYLLRAEGNNLE